MEARRRRRQRRLDRLEIPQEQVIVTKELLGRGGFGAVYLADFNGRNAAAKVVLIDHDMGPAGEGDGAEVFEGERGVVRDSCLGWLVLVWGLRSGRILKREELGPYRPAESSSVDRGSTPVPMSSQELAAEGASIAQGER